LVEEASRRPTENSSHQIDNQRMLRAVSGDGSVSTISASLYGPSLFELYTVVYRTQEHNELTTHSTIK